jgi:putative nucleotidyltransferase with HDIG domain
MYTDGQVTGITGILSNITQRKIAELKLQKQTYDLNERVKELNSLHLLSRLIDNKGDSAVDFFQAAVELLPPAMQYPEIACVRLTVEGREYDTAKWCEIPLKRAAGIIAGGTKVGSLEVRYLTDLTGNPEITFLDEERALIDSFAGRLGHLIYRWQLEGRLVRSAEQWKNATEGIVMAMASLLESRDFYTATHQRRVAKLAVAIAEDMQMEEDRVTGLRLAANVHDIGKISIPMEILNKSGKLSEAEYTIIKTHAEIGYLLLKPIGFPQPVAQIVYQHHERMDGSGYPQKLQGRDILPEARILSVAEVVQAMVSHRSYRRAHGIDKALEEIMRGSGVIYDADVVNSCVRLFGRGGFSF